MKKTGITWVIILLSIAAQAQQYNKLAEAFFTAVKEKTKVTSKIAIEKLAGASPENLKADLDLEDEAKVFWLNIYNTFVQHLLSDKPELFKERARFFSTPYFIIAGEKLSLDDVEHGILRHSRSKY